jgi:hypothetical protein
VGFFVRRRESSLLEFADENEKATNINCVDVFKGLWVRPMRRGCDRREQSNAKGCCEATILLRSLIPCNGVISSFIRSNFYFLIMLLKEIDYLNHIF